MEKSGEFLKFVRSRAFARNFYVLMLGLISTAEVATFLTYYPYFPLSFYIRSVGNFLLMVLFPSLSFLFLNRSYFGSKFEYDTVEYKLFKFISNRRAQIVRVVTKSGTYEGFITGIGRCLLILEYKKVEGDPPPNRQVSIEWRKIESISSEPPWWIPYGVV